MNSVNLKNLTLCTKALVVSLVLSASAAQAWEVDLSRRQVDFKRISNQSRLPASAVKEEQAGIIEQVLDSGGPAQDIVIMNTEKGFVPETVYLRKGTHYKVHVVNVNPKEKNVSFVFDAFAEHHNTLFGQVKTFEVTPKADGIFTYQCPETALQGRVVIAAPDSSRKPASN